MTEIQYAGELLWPKNLGQILLLLSFFSTFLAAYSYYQASKREAFDPPKTTPPTTDQSWKKLGNIAFSVQGISMLIVVGLIFYLMINKHYEYTYVQAHVSDDLPFQYIFSAFWEGQEGSFMLWIFWHNILAWIIMLKNSKWVAPSLFFLSLIQIVILSMIQGIHFVVGDWMYKLGSNPLSLLRETMDIPLFANADYVSLLQGTGLNPLLQNYWMTIHPPVLFLGFASVSIPFCYALGSLLVKDYRSWLKPTLKWSLFSASILGIGILMGAAWAYEALTFGGYWAWDPVENTSLVPWITLVAGVHTNMIARSTKYSIKSTYWFYILSFLLIVYSTTLTRSGVLGDTSVHAFTEMGLESQLGFFIGLFTLLSLYFYFSRSKNIPTPKVEESLGSREFWMFIGALVLLFSALMITASSSLPIFNKIIQLFNPEFVSMVLDDPIAHYNKYQLWIGLLVGLLSAVSIFFRYNERKPGRLFGKPSVHLGISLVLSIVLHILLNQWLKLPAFQFHLLLFAGLFTIVSNLDYMLAYAKISGSTAASTLSHAGFGIMLVGVLASGINKRNLSNNTFVFTDVIAEDKVMKNIPLIKNKPMFMNGYWVEYKSDTVIGQNRYFDLAFKQVDQLENVIDSFTVRPNILYSNDFSKVAATNPDTKHYWHKDIFTSIASLPTAQQDVKFAREMEDTLNYKLVDFEIGTVSEYDGYTIEIADLKLATKHREYEPEVGDLPIEVTLNIQDSLGNNHITKPATVLRNTVVYKFHGQVDDLHSRYRINERSFEKLIKPDPLLEYDQTEMESRETIDYKGFKIRFDGFRKLTEAETSKQNSEDISVKASLEITAPDGEQKIIEPTFTIRDKQILPVRDLWWQKAFYGRLSSIDPSTGKATLDFAVDQDAEQRVFLEIANNVPRSDLIAIEVLEFPGINFVWWGCIAMMLGLGLGSFYRLSSK